eukprot:g1449.t1
MYTCYRTGKAGSVPEFKMAAVGGALGGDWNAAQNVAPKNAHWKPRTPTWIRINAGDDDICTGFLTILQPRSKSETKVIVDSFEILNDGKAFAILTSGGIDYSIHTIYLLGIQTQLQGIAAVIGLNANIGMHLLTKDLDHVELMQGSFLDVPKYSLQIRTSANVSLTIKSLSKEQYSLRIHSSSSGSKPVFVSAILPWDTPPKQVNVWRGAHVWAVSNTTLNSGILEPLVKFEALIGYDYLIERQCIRSKKAGYGDGGWLCSPEKHVNEVDEL